MPNNIFRQWLLVFGKACLLPDAHKMHGIQNHDQTRSVSTKTPRKGHDDDSCPWLATRKELEVGNTLRPRQIELPYFHAVVQHVRSVVNFDSPSNGDWTVIKPPDSVVLLAEPNPTPDMFVGTQRVA